MRVAEAIESGMVGVSKGLISDPAVCGIKQSGLGREGWARGSRGIPGGQVHRCEPEVLHRRCDGMRASLGRGIRKLGKHLGARSRARCCRGRIDPPIRPVLDPRFRPTITWSSGYVRRVEDDPVAPGDVSGITVRLFAGHGEFDSQACRHLPPTKQPRCVTCEDRVALAVSDSRYRVDEGDWFFVAHLEGIVRPEQNLFRTDRID